jgi:hypothetical protein
MIAQIIENRRKKGERNQRMIGIAWAADDENLYHFTRDKDQPKIKFTVCSHYLCNHGVTLRYPKMPIVLTQKGYFPAEFLFQAKSPARGANSLEQCKRVLDFHDHYAGRDKIIHLKNTVAKLELLMQGKMQEMQRETGQQADILDTRQFNFEVDDAPLEVAATLLPEPNLVFRGKQGVKITNGAWNLRDARFSRYSNVS